MLYHAVQFYKDENSLARSVASFLAEGFRVGHPGVVIATPVHAEAISGELANCGLHVGALRMTGDLLFCDARKMLATFMVAGLPNPVLFRMRAGEVMEQLCGGRGPRPVRAYGEMVDLLWQDGYCDGAIKLEILWNQLAAIHEFSLLCGYAFGHFHKKCAIPATTTSASCTRT
jgi:MEDS: MEthanogen/methylotroph, DcmR Sensory domain